MLGFRVWDKEENKFINTDSFVMSNCGLLAKLVGLGGAYCGPRFVPMQFTGMYDWQKKPIYEGDFLSIRYYRRIGDSEIKEPIHYHVGDVVCFLQFIRMYDPIEKLSCDGNIYENLELWESYK
jgi:hypothetical protein